MYNTAILRLIKMTYTGEELELQLRAWQKYPTLKTDCALTARQKEGKRAAYVKRLKEIVNS